ncbi:hypothetical protein SAY86_030613 [Trapa natans]|uniref:Uncharacterized protein n=1 Tax=Trapa natans TaxID=22666 RepID=A0AAN7RCX2_TRANT|nr:hypothetical protein SAY86_030613 [Trapa natans]
MSSVRFASNKRRSRMMQSGVAAAECSLQPAGVGRNDDYEDDGTGGRNYDYEDDGTGGRNDDYEDDGTGGRNDDYEDDGTGGRNDDYEDDGTGGRNNDYEDGDREEIGNQASIAISGMSFRIGRY